LAFGPLVDKTMIGTRWIFNNKVDKDDEVVRNKDGLVAHGYN